MKSQFFLIYSFLVLLNFFCKITDKITFEDNKSYYYTLEKTLFLSSLEESNNIIREINPKTKIEIIKNLDSNNSANWFSVKIDNQIGFIKKNSVTKFSIPNKCSSFQNFLDENFKKIGEPKIFNSRRLSNKNKLEDDNFLDRNSQSYTENAEYVKEEYYEGGSETLILENISISEGLLIGINCNELFSEIDFSFYKDFEKIDIRHPNGAYLWLSVKKVGKKTYIKYSSTS